MFIQTSSSPIVIIFTTSLCRISVSSLHRMGTTGIYSMALASIYSMMTGIQDFHQKSRGSSKACKVIKILAFSSLFPWNLLLHLPPSNLTLFTQLALHTIALSKVKQFHHLPWAYQHMCPHRHAQHYRQKSGNLLQPHYHPLRSILFLMYLRAEGTTSHNTPSLILGEALVVLGQSWSSMRANSHAVLYLV